MLTFTADQLSHLHARRQRVLHARVAQQMGADFPFDRQVLGRDALQRVVDLACSRAARWGVRCIDDVCDYARMAFVFGSFFDQDPMLPWAGRILADPRINASHRMFNLRAWAATWLAGTAGEDGAAFRAALRRLRQVGLDDIARPRDADPVEDLRLLLDSVFPEQAAVTRPPALRALRAAAAQLAQARGLGEPAGIRLYALLVFLLGVGFDRDPLHPWTVAPLAQPGAPAVKARALLDAGRAQLARYDPRALLRAGELP